VQGFLALAVVTSVYKHGCRSGATAPSEIKKNLDNKKAPFMHLPFIVRDG